MEIDTRQWLSLKAIEELVETRKQKGDITVEHSEEDRGGVEIRSYQFPLDFYHKRRHITTKQFRAGSRLHALFYHSMKLSRHSQWSYEENSGRVSDPEDKLAVPSEFIAAIGAIRGLKETAIAVNVCCHGEKAGKGGAMLYLRSALDDLVEHFKEK